MARAPDRPTMLGFTRERWVLLSQVLGQLANIGLAQADHRGAVALLCVRDQTLNTGHSGIDAIHHPDNDVSFGGLFVSRTLCPDRPHHIWMHLGRTRALFRLLHGGAVSPRRSLASLGSLLVRLAEPRSGDRESVNRLGLIIGNLCRPFGARSFRWLGPKARRASPWA
jgi:hypothetical protein